MKVIKFIFGNDWKSTLLGYALGGLQLASGQGWKNASIATGIALLGRITNELQAKFPLSK